MSFTSITYMASYIFLSPKSKHNIDWNVSG